MSGHHGRRNPSLIGRCVLILVLATLAIPGAAVVATAPSERAQMEVHLFSARTVVIEGRTRVIAFGVADPPAADHVLECRMSDPRLAAVVRQPEVLAGRDLGYIRVMGLRPGVTELVIGDRTITLEVTAPRHDHFMAEHAPAIIGPVTGATVWGRVTVGVEVSSDGPDAVSPVQLRLSDGTRLDPVEDTGTAIPPHRQLRFELDTFDLPAGRLEITPVLMSAKGGELVGSPIRVRVVHPAAGSVFAGEAEADFDVKRPQRFGDNRHQIGRDRNASGGQYVVNASAIPAVCLPLEVKEAGRYQVMLVASGTRAQGALPTIGIVIDENQVSTTNGRLLGEGWHRLAVGVPIALKQGAHVITPFFANDFVVAGVEDRNLFLDYFEILRVDAATGPAREGAEMTGRMMDAMMADGAQTPAGEWSIHDPAGLESSTLRIGLTGVLDGASIAGVTEIEGRCWWPDMQSHPAPMVTLFINDEPHDSQRSGAPRFWVDPGWFRGGANRIQLVARSDSGVEVRTPVQTMHRPAKADEQTTRPARRHLRFSIHDERWVEGVREILRNHQDPKERRAAVMSTKHEMVLELPETLEGSHKIFLESFGETIRGAPVASIRLRRGGEDVLLGEAEIGGGWQDTLVADVEFPPGPKELIVAFTNPFFKRNLLVQGVILARNPDAVDHTPPLAEILYPPDGHEAYLADALVARAADDSSLASVEVILDGQSTGLNQLMSLQPGDVVLPLPLRRIEPGEHTIALQATDTSGNLIRSEPRTIIVRSDPPPTPGRYERAVHLLNRLAYGPDPRELGALLVLGEDEWLTRRLAQPFDDPGELAALGLGLPYFANIGGYEVPRRAISHALVTPNPVRARFVFWVENHFSTWLQKTQSQRKWQEHVTFSRLGVARFDDLLNASTRSPAMLAYLDQERSFAGNLNENYAREVMELHTMGVHGGYDQQDVTNLAQLLTGWTSSFEGDGRGGGEAGQRYTFRFDPRLNDASATEVLGLRFDEATPGARFDRTCLALEMLAAHPSTASFVCRKLAEHYLVFPADESLVEDLTSTYHETGGDLAEVLRTLVKHEVFWRNLNPLRVASAQDYAFRMCRTASSYQPWGVADFLQRCGYGMFDRPTPDGYPEEDLAHTDSNAMIQRWRLVQDMGWLLADLVPNGWRHDQSLAEDVWAQGVVDVIAIRLTGRVLDEASNEAALQLLSLAQGNRDERIRLIGPLIARLPEVNLR